MNFSKEPNKYNDDNGCPQWLFRYLNNIYDFSYDLACNSWNMMCKKGIQHDKGFDSFRVQWSELNRGRYNYCFPPISRPNLQRFIEKAWKESKKGAKTVMIVPLKTLSTVYYENYRANEVIIINPKVRFLQAGYPLPNGDATAILIYNEDIREEKLTYLSFLNNEEFKKYERI